MKRAVGKGKEKDKAKNLFKKPVLIFSRGWIKMRIMDSQVAFPDLLIRTPQGTWRIAGTRVSLDSVIYSFWDGATPEEICQEFPSLSLAQVYGVIGYYLQNREKVDVYLKKQQHAAERLDQELKVRHRDFLRDLRQRLIARRQSPTPA